MHLTGSADVVCCCKSRDGDAQRLLWAMGIAAATSAHVVRAHVAGELGKGMAGQDGGVEGVNPKP